MKLSLKLFLGFGAVVALTVGLGAVGVFNMRAAVASSESMMKKYVPEMEIAGEASQAAASLNLAVRTFGFTGDANQLKQGREYADKLDAAIKDGEDLVAAYPELVKLAEVIRVARPAATRYREAMDQTGQASDAIEAARGRMNTAAGEIVTAVTQLESSQYDKLDADIEAARDAAALQDRRNKLERIAKINTAIAQIRIAAFKTQALRDTAIMQEAMTGFTTLEAEIAALRPTFVVEEDKIALGNLEKQIAAYRTAVTEVTAGLNKLDEIAAVRSKAGNELRTAASTILEIGVDRVKTAAESDGKSLQTASTLITVGVGIAAVVGALIAVFVTRSITRPITRIAQTLSSGAQQTASAAGQVSGSSQSLAQGASEQAAALEETTSALQEMSSMTRKNAESAGQATDLAGEAKSSADKGNAAMTRMSEAITSIQKSAQDTAKIIKVIDEIAFQTNLLALNAAVEAARAGEAGKGFAVVAEEVRNLAMRSAEAAKNTASLIEESVQASRNGVAISTDVGNTLSEINVSVAKVNDLIAEIARSSQEQSRGIDQVNQAVTQMDQVTQSSAANAEESAAAAEELSSQAAQLNTVVDELTQLVTGARGNSASNVMRPISAAKVSSQRAFTLPADDKHQSGDFAEFRNAA